MTRGTARGAVLVLAASGVWGTSGVAAGLIPDVPPIAVGAATLAAGAVVLAAVHARRVGHVLRLRSVRPLVLIGAGAIGVYIVAFFLGMAWSGVAVGTVLAIASAPVFVLALEGVVDRRRPSRRESVATLVTVAGGVALVLSRVPGAPAVDPLAGSAVALVAGFCYAAFTFLVRRLIAPAPGRPEGLPEVPVMAAVQVVAAVPLGLVALLAGVGRADGAGEWGTLVYIALGPSALGYLLYARGLGSVRASTAAVLTLGEPLVAAVLAVLVLGETITPLGWVAIGVTAGGLLLTTGVGSGPAGPADGPGARSPGVASPVRDR